MNQEHYVHFTKKAMGNVVKLEIVYVEMYDQVLYCCFIECNCTHPTENSILFYLQWPNLKSYNVLLTLELMVFVLGICYFQGIRMILVSEGFIMIFGLFSLLLKTSNYELKETFSMIPVSLVISISFRMLALTFSKKLSIMQFFEEYKFSSI